MPSERSEFERIIRQDIKANIDWILSQGSIPPHQRKKLKNPSLIRAIATFLYEKNEFKDNDSGVNFYLLELKGIRGKASPFVFCIPADLDFINKKGSKALRRDCFVGCRFGPIRDELSNLLEPILSYYGYRIKFGDTGFKSGQIFDTILDSLDAVDFAIFDNRGTESKPNVYCARDEMTVLSRDTIGRAPAVSFSFYLKMPHFRSNPSPPEERKL